MKLLDEFDDKLERFNDADNDLKELFKLFKDYVLDIGNISVRIGFKEGRIFNKTNLKIVIKNEVDNSGVGIDIADLNNLIKVLESINDTLVNCDINSLKSKINEFKLAKKI